MEHASYLYTLAMLDSGTNRPKSGATRSITLNDHLERTLEKVRRLTGVALAFGGPVDSDGVLLSHFNGPVVGPLSGVKLKTGTGLGGKVAVAQRPIVLGDYVASPGITHQYDRVIKAEGLRSMAAIPVVVGRQSIAVVYGALRSPETVGGRVVDILVREVRVLEQQVAVEQALDDVRAVTREDIFRENRLLRGSLRDLYADLRQLAASTKDPIVRLELQKRLTDLEKTHRARPHATSSINLTPRELDVLTVVATGAKNSEIAAILNLTTSTVKSYMKVIMNKLDASTRYEAVNVARRAALIL